MAENNQNNLKRKFASGHRFGKEKHAYMNFKKDSQISNFTLCKKSESILILCFFGSCNTTCEMMIIKSATLL